MKRTLSVILTLAMLMSLFTVFFVTEVSAATVISNSSPAIPATVGSKITLSNYSVTFDGDTSATSGVTWKNGSTTITEFTPTTKGVTTLTATSGSKTKNIYVVAKNSSESEYVLYEASMSSFASTSALTAAGWTLPSTASISGGDLVINGTAVAGTAYLPAWLGEFGDYSFTANAKLLSANEGTRWFSLVYRDQNRSDSSFYQMCIRENNTAANGIEFAERHSGGWKVIAQTSGGFSTMTDAYRNITVNAVGTALSYFVANKQVLYLGSYTPVNNLKKGFLGLTASGSSLAIKSVKVTLQNSVPEELPSGMNLIYNNYHNTANLVNPIANVQKVTSATAANLANLSVAYIDLTGGADATAALKACVAANVVPTFYVTTNAQVDKVVSAVSSTGKYDVNVISNTSSVLAYLRGKNSRIRAGLSLSIATEMADGVITSKEANTIRKKVRSAPATFMVIDSKYAVKEALHELNLLAVAVWINVTSTPGTTAFREEAFKALTSGAHGIISSSASAIEEIINNDFAPNSFTRVPETIGHAGNRDIADENTMESFIAAYENGASILELDMGITSDGVPVLLHDNTIWRTTTYQNVVTNKADAKNIWEMTWAEVQQYNVIDTRTSAKTDTGKPIPKFEELLQYCQDKDVKLFVEFKWDAHNMIPTAMNLIKKYDMMDQCDFISFYGNCIGSVLTQESGMSTSFIFNNNTTDVKGTNASYAQSLLSLDYWIEKANYYKSTISCPRYTPVTNDLMQAATDRGMTVWPWTYDTKSSNDAFFACVDGMTMQNAQDFKDMVKTVSSEGIDLFAGQTYTGGSLTAKTYSGNTFSVSAADTVVSIVSGDCVKIQDGKLVAVKDGTATVILGCKTATYMGSEYVVYTQPITVTVGGSSANALKPLVAMAETATVHSLSEEDLHSLRALHAKAKELIAATNPSETEVKNTATALSALIEKFIVKSYTAPAPNYDLWSDPELLDDDGIRLIDGKKQAKNGESAAYSAWIKSESGVVDIIIDNAAPAYSDTFNGYFASNTGWGIRAPSKMEISYSDDGKIWKKINSDAVASTPTNGEGTWQLHTYTVKVTEPIVSRYVKFSVTPGLNDAGVVTSYVWVDEVEAVYSKFPLIYVSNVNKKITAGDCNIFTSKSNPISNESANITWTANIIAKWDSAQKAYIVKSVTTGNSESNVINLASDEILIAAHDWETNLEGQSSVMGSAINNNNVASAKVGQKIMFYGIDAQTLEMGVAPCFKLVDADAAHEHVYPKVWKNDSNYHWYECECGDVSNKAKHTAGDWVADTAKGVETQSCIDCGYVMNTRDIDNGDDPVDPPKDDPDTPPADDPVDPPKDEDPTDPPKDEDPVDPPKDEEPIDGDYMLGDINESGEIDSMDYILLKRNYFGTYKFTEKQLKIGDITKNGEIDSMDYILLKRAYFGTYEIK